MKKWVVCIILTLLISAGCDEFWQRGDEIAADVSDIASGAQAVLDSPAGRMIPPDLKLYGALGVALANGLVIGWQELRNRTMKKTTKAIVKGIEQCNPERTTELQVKKSIAEEMRRTGGDKFYAKANKIVDELKIS